MKKGERHKKCPAPQMFCSLSADASAFSCEKNENKVIIIYAVCALLRYKEHNMH